MRVGSSIILIDGYCYQSYNWTMMRPLGNLQNVINLLEEYQCDEVAIIRAIRDFDNMESFQKDIDSLALLNCMTPLSFGGGLRSIKHIDMLNNLPIERLIFSSAFVNEDKELIKYAITLYGHQSIQCMLPFKYIKNIIYIYSTLTDDYIPLDSINIKFIEKYANEIILLDTENEGLNNKFNDDILSSIPINNNKIIISGGIGINNIKLARQSNIASVLIDNKVLHKEYSIKGYKNA